MKTISNFAIYIKRPLILFSIGCMIAIGCTIKREYPRRKIERPVPGKPYSVKGKKYIPLISASRYEEIGYASWYGKQFHGRRTSSGEIYDMHEMTAAHKLLPFNTYVEVQSLTTGRKVIVRINDRGPFVKDRIIDLSYEAAKRLGIVGPGTDLVRIKALGYKEVRKVKGHYVTEYKKPARLIPKTLSIQVGSFIDRQNAFRLKRKLASLFPKKEIIIKRYYDGVNTFYRVRIKIYGSLPAATKFQEHLKDVGYTSSFLVSDD